MSLSGDFMRGYEARFLLLMTVMTGSACRWTLLCLLISIGWSRGDNAFEALASAILLGIGWDGIPVGFPFQILSQNASDRLMKKPYKDDAKGKPFRSRFGAFLRPPRSAKGGPEGYLSSTS